MKKLDAIQTLLKETMESIVELHVPLIVDVHNAENWALVKINFTYNVRVEG